VLYSLLDEFLDQPALNKAPVNNQPTKDAKDSKSVDPKAQNAKDGKDDEIAKKRTGTVMRDL